MLLWSSTELHYTYLVGGAVVETTEVTEAEATELMTPTGSFMPLGEALGGVAFDELTGVELPGAKQSL